VIQEVIKNQHEYLMSMAAQVAVLHEKVNEQKEMFLATRTRGDNPFTLNDGTNRNIEDTSFQIIYLTHSWFYSNAEKKRATDAVPSIISTPNTGSTPATTTATTATPATTAATVHGRLHHELHCSNDHGFVSSFRLLFVHSFIHSSNHQTATPAPSPMTSYGFGAPNTPTAAVRPGGKKSSSKKK